MKLTIYRCISVQVDNLVISKQFLAIITNKYIGKRTLNIKSPLTPLYQRGGYGRLPLAKGGWKGFYDVLMLVDSSVNPLATGGIKGGM